MPVTKEQLEQEINQLQVERQAKDDEISRKQVLLGQLSERAERVNDVVKMVMQFEIQPVEIYPHLDNGKKVK